MVLDDGQLGVDPEDLGAGAGGEGRPGHADVLCHGRGGHAGGGTMQNHYLLGLYAKESSLVLAGALDGSVSAVTVAFVVIDHFN